VINPLLGIRPARGLAYIRHIETAERYGSSPIIITPQSRDKITCQQFEIVAVGNYERCEDEDECVRHHNKRMEHVHRLKIGEWVLVKNRAWTATPDPAVFVVKQDAILGKFVER
jgi:co-chaperonin GroES (HSP10)